MNNNDNFFGKNNNEINDNDLPMMNHPTQNNDFANNQNINMGSVEETNTQNAPEKIVIPEAYYKKLEEEKQQKMEAEKQAQIDKEISQKNSQETNALLVTVIAFAVLIYVCIYMFLTVSQYSLIGLLAVIVVSSFAFAKKDQKESNIPNGILVGGIATAAMTFFVSMLNNNEEIDNIWTYYAIVSGVIAVYGYIISKIITTFITESENIKAVQTIGIFIVLAGLIAAPIYLKQKFPEQYARLLLRDKKEIIATSEEEFIIKTLKNRYGRDFVCGNKKSSMDTINHKMVNQFMCTDEKVTQENFDNLMSNIKYGTEEAKRYVQVASIPFDKNNNQYIIEDNYIDLKQLDIIKELIATEIQKKIPDITVKTSLYPNGNCLFVGDCADCEEYFATFDNENTIEKRYEVSKELDYSKSIGLSQLEFMNKYEYKYIINIYGNFIIGLTEDENASSTINDILSALNSTGLKNTFGYEIYLRSTNESNLAAYHVVGKTNSDKTFKDPTSVKV